MQCKCTYRRCSVQCEPQTYCISQCAKIGVFSTEMQNFVRHQMILCKHQLIGNISNAKTNSKKNHGKNHIDDLLMKTFHFKLVLIDYNCCHRYKPQIVFLIPIKYQISLITKQQKHLRTLLSMMNFFLVHQCRLGQFIWFANNKTKTVHTEATIVVFLEC